MEGQHWQSLCFKPSALGGGCFNQPQRALCDHDGADGMYASSPGQGCGSVLQQYHRSCISEEEGETSLEVLSWEAQAILSWSKQNDIFLLKKNIIADSFSRRHQIIRSEWALNPQMFPAIKKK